MNFIKIRKIECITILFLTTYFGLSLYFFPIHYAVNDDNAILTDILNNVNTSFMSPILGYFLSFLYYLNSDIAWYGCFLYFIHFISLYIIITSFLKNNYKQIYIYIFLFLYLLFYLAFILRVSYNNTSIMFGISVFIYVLINIKNMSNKKVGWIGLLFVVSYLIRQESIYFIVCFSLPAFYFIKKHYKKLFYFIFPIIMIISIHRITDNFAFSKEQQEFNEFNRIRGEFHQFPVSIVNYDNQKILSVNNWTTNDYILLLTWFFIDENKYNIETLNNIFIYSISVLSDDDYLKKVIDIFELNSIYLFLSSILILFYFTINFKKSLLLLLYFFYSTFGIIALIIFFRFPERIAIPVFMIIFLVLFYSITLFGVKEKLSIFSKIILILLLTPLISHRIYELSKLIPIYSKLIRQYNYNYTDKLNKNYANAVFLLPIRPNIAMPMEFVNPLKSNQNKFHIIPTGWQTYSPSFYNSLKKYFGINKAYDIFPEVANKNAYLLLPEKWAQFISIYLKENFQEKYGIIKTDDITPVFKEDGSIGIYKVFNK